MIRSKFALHIAVACAASFAAGGQATVSGDFTGLVAIGGGRKIYLECRATSNSEPSTHGTFLPGQARRAMSEVGTSATWRARSGMSPIGGRAEVARTCCHVAV